MQQNWEHNQQCGMGDYVIAWHPAIIQQNAINSVQNVEVADSMTSIWPNYIITTGLCDNETSLLSNSYASMEPTSP